MLCYLWLCHTHRNARSPADHALCHGLSRAVNYIMRHLYRTLTLVSLGCAVSTFIAFYSRKLYKKTLYSSTSVRPYILRELFFSVKKNHAFPYVRKVFARSSANQLTTKIKPSNNILFCKY